MKYCVSFLLSHSCYLIKQTPAACPISIACFSHMYYLQHNLALSPSVRWQIPLDFRIYVISHINYILPTSIQEWGTLFYYIPTMRICRLFTQIMLMCGGFFIFYTLFILCKPPDSQIVQCCSWFYFILLPFASLLIAPFLFTSERSGAFCLLLNKPWSYDLFNCLTMQVC